MLTKLLALHVAGPNGTTINVSAPAGLPNGGIFNFQNYFGTTWEILFLAAIIICLFFVIWGGFNWITSEGDKQRLNQARQKIVWAIIGLVIVFLAYFIISLVTGFFGYNNGNTPCPRRPNAGGHIVRC